MNTINEDYCSFEVSKLLKEKGLREPNNIRYGYNKDGKLTEPIVCWEVVEPFYPRVTHQFAMKWLREVHKVHISIYPFNRELPVTDEFYYTCDIATSESSSKEGHLRGVWKTYEEATEAALKYTLENLI